MNYARPVLPYQAPHCSAQLYARRALEVLREVELLDIRLLAYLLAPSNVLALAGLRSYSPYNDVLPDNVEMAPFCQVLTKHHLLWFDEQPNVTNPTLASFALVNLDVADSLHMQYPFGAVKANGQVAEHTQWGFYAWQAGLDIALARVMESGELPSKWLRDWWSPMNVRFGMLLGYPGVAIEAFVESESQGRSAELVDVLVAPGHLRSADVAFEVRADRRNHDQVVGTVEVWRATLDEVYAAYPLDVLAADPQFSETVRAKR